MCAANCLLSCRFDPTSNKYDPFPRDWLKQQIFEYLRRQASK
jgi:hypothetical protein